MRLMCDNAVTVAYIKNEGGTQSYTLMQRTLGQLKWCDRKAITLVPAHLPVVHNIQADSLSRTRSGRWPWSVSDQCCPVGRTTGRLVCDVRQQMTCQVCIAISGPHGGVHGCLVSSLGQREGSPVRLSTVQDGPSSPAEDRSISRCSDGSGRSSAGNSFLVPGTSGSVPRRSHPVYVEGQPLLTEEVALSDGGDRDSSLPAIKSSRVETLRAILVAKRHSREAAYMMSRALRESLLHVYESH